MLALTSAMGKANCLLNTSAIGKANCLQKRSAIGKKMASSAIGKTSGFLKTYHS